MFFIAGLDYRTLLCVCAGIVDSTCNRFITSAVSDPQPTCTKCRGQKYDKLNIPYLMVYNTHEFIGRTTISAEHTVGGGGHERYSLAYTYDV